MARLDRLGPAKEVTQIGAGLGASSRMRSWVRYRVSRKPSSHRRSAEIAKLKQQLKDNKLTPERVDAGIRDRMATVLKAKALMGDAFAVDGKGLVENQESALWRQVCYFAKECRLGRPTCSSTR